MVKKYLEPFYLVPPQVYTGIDMLRHGAETVFCTRWDYRGWRLIYTEGDPVFDQSTWNQTVITKINETRAQIHRMIFPEEQNPPINRITCSIETGLLFDDTPYFTFGNLIELNGEGLPILGVLQSRYTVYRDVHQEGNRIYIGTDEYPKMGCIFVDNHPYYEI
jgi:hypothetical protein